MSMVFFAMNIVSTVMIVRKQTVTDKAKGAKEYLYDLYHRGNVNSISNSNTTATLSMILGNEKSLNLFMNHLSKEYSLEILLSTIEFMQFQQYLQKHMNGNMKVQYTHQLDVSSESTVDSYEIKVIKFPVNIPRSQIIEECKVAGKQQSVLDVGKDIALGLYDKYIKFGSEFEINISGIMKDKLEDLIVIKEMKDMTVEDLCFLYEDCKNEMITLQISALHRMRYEKEYNDIMTLFQSV